MERRAKSARLGLNGIVDLLRQRYEQANRPQLGNPRVVVVLGAAASFPSGMPSWSDPRLKDRVFSAAERAFADPSEFLNIAWQRLAPELLESPGENDDPRSFILSKATLDMLCSTACEIPTIRERVIQVLRDEFARYDTAAGPPPQLGYELLAHLMKHRCIDCIITFNFDELIDQALHNELGPDGYARITSEHQSLEGVTRDRPSLVKLHGTIGAPDTLRFSRDRTSVLPRSMISLLDHFVLGCDPVSIHSDPDTHVAIFSYGYSWNDRDFVRWVQSRTSFVMRLTSITAESQPSLLEKSLPADKRDHVDVRNVFQGGDGSFDKCMWAIAEKLQAEARPPVRIARHLLLGHLFGKDSQLPHSKEYRFRAELLLHLVKCKGMVNLSVMARDCRLDRYRPSENPRTEDYLSRYRFLKKSSVADVTETYFADAASLGELERIVREQLPANCNVSIEVPLLGDDGTVTPRQGERWDVFVNQQLREVFDGPEVEVVPGRDRRHDWLFASPVPLETLGAMQQKSADLLRRTWTYLFVIAESGAWLFRPHMREHLNGKAASKVLCLESSDAYLDDWRLYEETRRLVNQDRSELNGGPQVCFGKLAWWKHSRHLTLAVNENDKASPFVGAVYFRRTLKTSQISPVYVESQQDCLELLVTFLSYANRIVDEIDHIERCAAARSDGAAPATTRGKWEPAEKREFCVLLAETCRVARIIADKLSRRQRRLLDRLGAFAEQFGQLQ